MPLNCRFARVCPQALSAEEHIQWDHSSARAVPGRFESRLLVLHAQGRGMLASQSPALEPFRRFVDYFKALPTVLGV